MQLITKIREELPKVYPIIGADVSGSVEEESELDDDELEHGNSVHLTVAQK